MTPEEANAIVGDDIAYWLHNPFVDRDALAGKVCWWIERAAAAAGAERDEALDALAHVVERAAQNAAERDEARAALARVEAACQTIERHIVNGDHAAATIRAALAPAPSTPEAERWNGTSDHGYEAPSDTEEGTTYPAGHGWTPSTSPFSKGDSCRVMLARYCCNYSRDEHDPDPPLDLDVFGYRRGRFATFATPDPVGHADDTPAGA